MLFLYLPILIVGVVPFVGLALFLAYRPAAGAILVVATYVVEALLVKVSPISLGLLIYPADIVFVLLFVAVVLRYAMGMTKLKRVRRIPIFLFVLFAVSVLRGFALFGLKQTGVEGREWFYFLSGILYFSSFNLSAQVRKKVTTTWLIASIALVSIAVFRWIATATGIVIHAAWATMAGDNSRVLDASQADFLALAFFASMFLNMSNAGPKWQRKLFYLLGPILLVLQQRTVWVVMIIGLLWLGLRDARFRKKAIGALVGMAIVGIVLTVFLFGHQSEVIAAALQESATNDGTFLWRAEGWYQLLFNNPARNMLNDTVGQPWDRVRACGLRTARSRLYCAAQLLCGGLPSAWCGWSVSSSLPICAGNAPLETSPREVP